MKLHNAQKNSNLKDKCTKNFPKARNKSLRQKIEHFIVKGDQNARRSKKLANVRFEPRTLLPQCRLPRTLHQRNQVRRRKTNVRSY